MSQDFNYQEALLQCKTMEDITGKNGLVQKIIKDAVEHILGQELEDYISKKTAAGIKSRATVQLRKTLRLLMEISAYGCRGLGNLVLSRRW